MYWMCSMTKIVSSVPILYALSLPELTSIQIALLKVIESGLISYDTPLEDIIPEFGSPVVITSDNDRAAYKPAQNKILMKHLLNHSSGLSYAIPFYEGADRIERIPWPLQAAAFEDDHSVAKFLSLIKVCTQWSQHIVRRTCINRTL